MNFYSSFLNTCLWVIICSLVVSCSGSQQLADNNFTDSDEEIESITKHLSAYDGSLETVQGKGRAIVSEPGNTERATIQFASNRNKSMVTIKNGLGIEGGQLLTDGDTLLVYNKVDKYARKIPVSSASLDHINRLASLNILDMISFSVSENDVKTLRENDTQYLLQLHSGAKIYVHQETMKIQKVEQPASSKLPYSKIEYNAYGSIDEFTLPRRISIFGPEGKSKIALQLTALDLNVSLEPLTITLPDDIRIYYE